MITWLFFPFVIEQTFSFPMFQSNSWIAAQLNRTTQNTEGVNCPSPILSRLQRHRIISGETIVTIAQQYNLIPETLIRLNPSLQGGTIPVGQEILIPPFNGIRLEVPTGTSWQDLEAAYGVRADVLFEINGCQKQPKTVFIPGISWSPIGNSRNDDYTELSCYPLPSVAKIELDYGWQISPINQQNLFHSGLDLLAEIKTPVLAAASGTAIYVGSEENYGNLVIINHGSERQTRYAHLDKIQVKLGQTVKTGDVLGTVGMTGKPDVKVAHLHFEVRYQLPIGWVAQDPSIHLKMDKKMY
ncbi:peptidase [Aphanothece hegewaldii CCALA 016]|uniref:Peptidase n=1 Tax=Aphanothece hegewaldii CCALA 016 TaxID=2107694 RepID=A0A2T1LSF7_9CHRO|nr:peptidase [Aphanothece hegewaldii CCALA 016]